MKPHTTRLAAGFTLVELVTALIIIGILAAAGLPRLFDNHAFQQRGYVDEVASAMRYAQRIAVASGCETAVRVNASDYVTLQRATLASCNNNASAWSTQVLRADGTLASGVAPNSVTLTPGGSVIVFAADGAVANGAPPTLIAAPFSIAIDRHSGRVTVTP